MKKIAADIIILYSCTKNQNHMRQKFLLLWAIFSSLSPTPPNNPENKNFEKMENASREVIIVHMCT